ncbi:MAG: DUF421 domain-containing protein [Clostridia bacterium]|nr:DUF421 domain-containing protein [Clostridia bacterium]
MTVFLLRTLLFFAVLNVGMRLMGKRQIGEIQLSEFVSAVMLSELALMPITQPDTPLLYGLLGVALLCSLEVINAHLCRTSSAYRRAMEGQPLVLVCKGRIQTQSLDRARISTDELFAAIRIAGYRGPGEADYVILEQSGAISVLPRAAAATLTPADLGVATAERGIWHPVVLDGKVQARTLGSTGRDGRWLERVLKEEGLKMEELIYLCIDDTGTLSYEVKDGK